MLHHYQSVDSYIIQWSYADRQIRDTMTSQQTSYDTGAEEDQPGAKAVSGQPMDNAFRSKGRSYFVESVRVTPKGR